jgi:hypothetical protein
VHDRVGVEEGEDASGCYVAAADDKDGLVAYLVGNEEGAAGLDGREGVLCWRGRGRLWWR